MGLHCKLSPVNCTQSGAARVSAGLTLSTTNCTQSGARVSARVRVSLYAVTHQLYAAITVRVQSVRVRLTLALYAFAHQLYAIRVRVSARVRVTLAPSQGLGFKALGLGLLMHCTLSPINCTQSARVSARVSLYTVTHQLYAVRG